MKVLTLTEAITELALGERMDADRLAVMRRAECDGWETQYKSLARSAHKAAAAQGRDIEFYRTRQNPLLRSPDEPGEVSRLFAETAQHHAAAEVQRDAIGRAKRKLLAAAQDGTLEMWGSFDGTGRSEQIPLPELRHLFVTPDEFGADTLSNKETSSRWSAVTISATSFASWREPAPEIVEAVADIALVLTTDRKLICGCMHQVYRAAREQSVSPPNVNEIIAPVNELLGRSNKRATATFIRKLAGEPEFAKQRRAQGPRRPAGLKPASELKI